MAGKRFNFYLGREATISCLEKLGFRITKNGSHYFCSLRDERTPSALINNDGSIHDYGSGFHGSIYHVLEQTGKIPAGLNKKESLEYCQNLLSNGEIPQSIVSTSTASNTFQEEQKKRKYIDREWFIKKFLKPSLLGQAYKDLLKKTITSIDDEKQIIELAKNFLIGFSKAIKNDCDRLVMPIFDFDGNIINLWRYNPVLKQNKLRFCKGRKRVSFNLSSLKNAPKDELVFLCEGEKDVLNATARGFLAVTPGSAVSNFTEEELECFRDRRVLIVGDYDEAGFKFNQKHSDILKNIAKEISIGSFEKNISKEFLKKGFDLTDYLTLKKRSK